MPGLRLPPSSWGPFFWHTIHIVAIGYPLQPSYSEKKAAKEFYESLVFLIPCPVCRQHYEAYLKENPISPFLDSRETLFEWTVKIHNLVNKDLGKPEVTALESLQWLDTLGQLGRSPIWTPKDEEAVNMKSFLKGVMATSLIGGAMVGGYLLYKKYIV
jgi:hypothetical protein